MKIIIVRVEPARGEDHIWVPGEGRGSSISCYVLCLHSHSAPGPLSGTAPTLGTTLAQRGRCSTSTEVALAWTVEAGPQVLSGVEAIAQAFF